MFNNKAVERFRRMSDVFHSFGSPDAEVQLGFSCALLTESNPALACFMRVAANLLEDDVAIDLFSATECYAISYHDKDERVVAILLVRNSDPHYVVDFAWTHPSYRRLGLFTSLMDTLIQCHWESHYGIRLNPPIGDAVFDLAAEKLGFKPISRMTEYRPFS